MLDFRPFLPLAFCQRPSPDRTPNDINENATASARRCGLNTPTRRVLCLWSFSRGLSPRSDSVLSQRRRVQRRANPRRARETARVLWCVGRHGAAE